MSRRNEDLWVTFTVAVLACAAAALRAPVAVTVVLGLVLFAAPGYLLGQLLAGSGRPALERLAVSAGLALCVPVIGGLLLYLARLPLNRSSWLGLLAGVTLVADVLLFVRRAPGPRLLPGARPPAGTGASTGGARSWGRLRSSASRCWSRRAPWRWPGRVPRCSVIPGSPSSGWRRTRARMP